jgi:hypothetical protein
MDDFQINDGNVDNLLPNEAGSSAFDDYNEDERIDEDLKQVQEEKHMIRSAKGPLLDNILEWFDETIDDIDRNSSVRAIMHGHEVFKTNPTNALDIASLGSEVARRLLEQKKNEILNLKNIHIPESER